MILFSTTTTKMISRFVRTSTTNYSLNKNKIFPHLWNLNAVIKIFSISKIIFMKSYDIWLGWYSFADQLFRPKRTIGRTGGRNPKSALPSRSNYFQNFGWFTQIRGNLHNYECRTRLGGTFGSKVNYF